MEHRRSHVVPAGRLGCRAGDWILPLEERCLLAAGLAGAYFNNSTLSGTPTLVRTDAAINFEWAASPGAGINADQFSVRWTGSVTAKYSQQYTFTTRSDDGVRLWVNGQKIIDNWTRHAPTNNSGSIALAAGQKVSIVMEFFEAWGGATARLYWQSASQGLEVIPSSALSDDNTQPPPPTPGGVIGTGDGLLGKYYGDTNFSFLKLQRVDPQVNFSWGSASPGSGVPADLFSTRWTGQVQAQYTQDYTFYTRTDDGVRLTVDGKVLIDKFIPQGATEFAGTVALVAGQKYNIQMDYFDRYGGATAELRWSSPSTVKQFIPRSQLYSGGSVNPPPTPGGTYQPDVLIQVHRETSFIGDNVINSTGAGQSKDAPGGFYPTVFKFRVYNDGTAADSFNITGPAGNANWRLAYYDSHNFGWDGGKSITAQVTGSGWNTGSINPGAFRDYRVEVLPIAAPGGNSAQWSFVATSTHDSSRNDVVAASSTNPVVRALAWRRQNYDDSGTYLMTLQNQGNLPDQFNITSSAPGSGWSVQFFDDQWGGNNVTTAVRSTQGWTTRVLQPWESQEFCVAFTFTDPKAPSITLTAASVAKPDTKEQMGVVIGDAGKPVAAPVFPIGVWTQPMSSFDKWKSRGVNTLIEYQGDGATIEQWSQAARDRDMYYIRRPLSNHWLDFGDTHLLAWALPDEPEITTRFPPATLAGWIDGWKQSDPNRPIWVNFAGGYVLGWQGSLNYASYKPFMDLVDWASSSIYPVTGWNRPYTSPGLDAPGQSIDRLEKWTGGKPQFAVIENSDQELSWIQQEIPSPNPGQFRAEVWDSIIRGARGVIYFPMSFKPGFKFDNTPPEIVAEMSSVNAKIQSLAGVLLSDIDPPTRGIAAGGPLVASWRVYNGKTYFIVLNFSEQAVTRQITLQGVGTPGTAVVHGENRSVSLSNGTFTDSFAPFGVHVYQVG